MNTMQRTTCQVCKRPLPRLWNRGRKRCYCSHTCKLKAYRARKKAELKKPKARRSVSPSSMQATCLICERPLFSQRKRGRKRMYCSANCKQKAYKKRKKVTRIKYRNDLRNNLLRLNHRTSDWHTPPEFIKAVREVFGGHIELDPASSEQANKTVQALRFFDRATNGLAQEWKGQIYLNPPHDRTNTITPWVDKLLLEYRQGHVESAILLVDAATSASWFQPLYNFPLCFVQGRIRFINGAGEIAGQPINGSVFVYLGEHPDTFVRIFATFGRIYLPHFSFQSR